MKERGLRGARTGAYRCTINTESGASYMGLSACQFHREPNTDEREVDIEEHEDAYLLQIPLVHSSALSIALPSSRVTPTSRALCMKLPSDPFGTT